MKTTITDRKAIADSLSEEFPGFGFQCIPHGDNKDDIIITAFCLDACIVVPEAVKDRIDGLIKKYNQP